MRARALIDGASFGPDALKAINQAFDQAWAEIAYYFAGDPKVTDAARIALANAILSVASNDSQDVVVLKRAGLQVMAHNYRLPPKIRASRAADAGVPLLRPNSKELAMTLYESLPFKIGKQLSVFVDLGLPHAAHG